MKIKYQCVAKYKRYERGYIAYEDADYNDVLTEAKKLKHSHPHLIISIRKITDEYIRAVR